MMFFVFEIQETIKFSHKTLQIESYFVYCCAGLLRTLILLCSHYFSKSFCSYMYLYSKHGLK